MDSLIHECRWLEVHNIRKERGKKGKAEREKAKQN
jgi:hypothetical protein